jgi:hypothetical protein
MPEVQEVVTHLHPVRDVEVDLPLILGQKSGFGVDLRHQTVMEILQAQGIAENTNAAYYLVKRLGETDMESRTRRVVLVLLGAARAKTAHRQFLGDSSTARPPLRPRPTSGRRLVAA